MCEDYYTEEFALYVLMRTDMASMTPGKSMAQACHAGGQFQKEFGKTDNYKRWAKQANGFGTTLVMAANLDMIEALSIKGRNHRLACGVVTDSTYPIEDGDVVHLLPIVTCSYIFIDRNNEEQMSVVEDLELLTKRYEFRDGGLK